MIDPNDAACSPATCLRAEAEDLMEKATEATLASERAAQTAQEQAQASESFLALAARYQRAADELEAIDQKTDAPFLDACPS